MLPFTLESIPGRVLLTVKDKDMVKDAVMGMLSLDPQKDCLFEEAGKAVEHRYEIIT